MHATLAVDLSALCANYQLLRARHAKKNVAAVVKANAYGLGVEAVSKALWAEGCREFFVATLEEGMELRGILPQARIGIFSGVFQGQEKEFTAHQLLPVLNTLEQVSRWKSLGHKADIIHVDTGMTRLGLTQGEAVQAAKLAAGDMPLIISHLACGGDPLDGKNAEQLSRFREALALFPGSRASLANSAGHFLSPDYHFDLGRPGCALYGISTLDSGANPMTHVATLSAPILQVRELDRNETIGYGGTFDAARGARIAVVGLGYGDGYFRSLSNKGFVFIGGSKFPVVGRVSMDMVNIDISSLPENLLEAATRAEFINAIQTVDDVAKSVDTIGYEIFTRLGQRVVRTYS